MFEGLPYSKVPQMRALPDSKRAPGTQSTVFSSTLLGTPEVALEVDALS